MSNKRKIEYRRASFRDIKDIRIFVDYWLSGRALRVGFNNAGNDYFVTPMQHKAYLKSQIVYIALENNEIVGWGVKDRNNVLLHLLVAADKRGLGIGRKILNILNPDVIRSKSDQQTDDPASLLNWRPNMLMNLTKIYDHHSET
jgi:GNAT superfamily N-acetyltransferase